MNRPYLLLRRPNSHGETETTAIGPFTSEEDMTVFLKGFRYANNPRSSWLGRTDKPWNVWITHPDDLFPWHPEQIRDLPDHYGVETANT